MTAYCCHLDDAGRGCPEPAAYAVWDRAGNETHACARHLAELKNPGDVVWERDPKAGYVRRHTPWSAGK